MAWPPTDPRIVVKRLPPFRVRAELTSFQSVLDEWTATMEERGVHVVDTSLHVVDHPRWGTLGYLVQPYLRPEEMATGRCKNGTRAEAEEILAAVVEAAGRGVDQHAFMEPQLPNWQVREDGSLALLDVSTPFIRDASGKDRLSTALFVRGCPAVLRPALARLVLPGVIDAYHSPRTAVRDLAGNLIRVGLEQHLEFVLDRARAVLGIDLTAREVREFFDKDARMWGVLQSLRHADRRWQQRVRRRPYPALLPPQCDPRTDYNDTVR
ncbi:DUF6206 family protein [Streptomyces sp. KL116D]|uniref:DUF6206 family protein n=1 Tax=Streptomyces sp. KL116D TaxID=3045152 RepID=UPI003556BC34